MAVAKEYQRQGIGKTLLAAAMGKFMEIFNTAGGIGLFVDAKDSEAKRYYKQFGFVALPSIELELFLPVQTIQDAFQYGGKSLISQQDSGDLRGKSLRYARTGFAHEPSGVQTSRRRPRGGLHPSVDVV